MTNYIQIDNISNEKWRNFAEQIDGRKPNINDPNDVGDAGDRQLSERELKKLQQKITEYYTTHPQRDALGVEVPVGKSVSKAMADVFGGSFKYLKYQAEQALAYLGKQIGIGMKSAGGPVSNAISPLLSQVR